MNGSFRIAKVLGIDVFVHWSFLLWLAIVFYGDAASKGLSAGIDAVAFTIALFACVVLHEFGHALTARAFGIGTKDITIMMLGGVARLMALRSTPTRELLIAVAGPAVNVAIAAVLLPIVLYSYAQPAPLKADFFGAGLLERLLLANIVMLVFNMIPSFPLDGGRVLRSLLAYVTSYGIATLIAARIGQAIAMVFAMVGIWQGAYVLALIGLFVFTGAQRELTMVRQQDEYLRSVRAQTAGPGYPPAGVP